MKSLTVALCFLLLAVLAAGAEYRPLTLEEARQYMALHPDQAAADIVKLDTVEHATGSAVTVTVPPLVLAVAGRDAALSWAGPLDISIAGGALHYQGTPAPVLFKDVVPVTAWWEKPFWTATGALAGVILDELGRAVLHR
jgi:hypothetical protein